MDISVTGKEIDVGGLLRSRVAAAIIEKPVDRAIGAHVVFCRERHLVREENIGRIDPRPAARRRGGDAGKAS